MLTFILCLIVSSALQAADIEDFVYSLSQSHQRGEVPQSMPEQLQRYLVGDQGGQYNRVLFYLQQCVSNSSACGSTLHQEVGQACANMLEQNDAKTQEQLKSKLLEWRQKTS